MSRPKSDPAGNPRKSLRVVPDPPANVAPRPRRPRRPRGLKDPGRRVWGELWDAGEPSGAYQPLDRLPIERYCRLVDEAAALRKAIGSQWIVAGSMGQPVIHPAAKALRSVEAAMIPLEDRLGISPEARTRLGISMIAHESALDQFIGQSRRGGSESRRG